LLALGFMGKAHSILPTPGRSAACESEAHPAFPLTYLLCVYILTLHILSSFSEHGIRWNAFLFFTSDSPGPFGRVAEPLRRGAEVRFGDDFGTPELGCQQDGSEAKGLVLTRPSEVETTIFLSKARPVKADGGFIQVTVNKVFI
jgi:hypothetical protein